MSENKKRIIVDYSTLPDDILEQMAVKYPYGYDQDIIKFPNAKGEIISAIRMETDDIIYLVKISSQLKQMIKDVEIDNEMIEKPEDVDDDEFGSIDDEDDEMEENNNRRRKNRDDDDDDDENY